MPPTPPTLAAMAGLTAAPETVRLCVLGASVDVVIGGSGHASAAEQVRAAWRHCLIEPGANSADAVVQIDDFDDIEAMLHQLSQEVTLRAIDARAGELLMLHGAALAHPETGATLAAIGPSGMGKSTWLRAHAPGRRYLSDETVAVDADLTVVSHAKPVSVVTGSLKRQDPPDAFGLLPADGTEWLAALWLLERDGSTPARLEPIELLDALPLLAQHASHLRLTPGPLHKLAAAVDGTGGLVRARYAEASDLAPFVNAALTGRR